MRPPILHSAKRFLRSPSVIVGEVAAIAFAGVLGTAFPQVFRSLWFLALTLLATASLSIAVAGQLRRLWAAWAQQPTEVKFRAAPFRIEFERPARSGLRPPADGIRIGVRTTGRLGLAGSPVFHLGLLLVIAAAALRALFAVEAIVDLVEGETLPPTTEGWAVQSPGLLARPFRLDCPVTLDSVRATRYDGGDLRDLRLRLSLQRASGIEVTEIAINQELRVPGGRLFLGSDFGPAALMEWLRDGGPPTREAALLADRGRGVYEGASRGPNGLCAHLRAHVGQAGGQPAEIEVRVMSGNALLFTGSMKPGEETALRGGQRLRLHGAPFWARLRGSRDPALWLAYAGFALVLAGATLMFAVVKVDTCVAVTPAGDMERVFVALRAQRLAPLFEERFQRLVREQGGAA